MEEIIETKICKQCGAKFDITDKDLEFYDKISPTFDGKKHNIPTPTLCPDCRQQRRLTWQNMFKLYKRKCDFTGENMISNFSNEKNNKVYAQKYWWGDKRDFKTYGKEINLNKSIFSQIEELLASVPLPSLLADYKTDINSEFTNFAGHNKNCYLIFHADMNEDCFYGTGLKKSKKCVDSLNVFDSEFTYESIDCKSCYNIKYSQDCQDCKNSWFLKNCLNCSNCFGCVNKNNSEYMIFNEQVSKDEYNEFINNFDSSDKKQIDKYIQKTINLRKKLPYRTMTGHQNENCEGDHIFQCKNVKSCFDVQESRDMKFCERIYNGPNRDCYDIDQFGMRIERVYESSVIGDNSNSVITTSTSYNINNIYYSIYAFHSNDCFACIGIDNAQYCILNKQYSKEEYNKLVPQIIEKMKNDGEWGEFFPSSISPFGYNETVANEYFPLTKQQALEKGFNRSDYEAPKPNVSKIISASDLPENIEDISDNILTQAIECEITKKPFRITKSELDFYRKHNLPIPRRHPDQRHLDRMKLRNPRKLFNRNCTKCGIDIKTTYSPDREEIVYCESCYNKEIY